MIKFQKVSKIYPKNVVALENISIDIQKGEFLVIAGKSGSGKTTFLKLISMQEKPTYGTIFINNKNLSELKMKEILAIKSRMGIVYQDFNLVLSLSVFENIAFPLILQGLNNDIITEKVNRITDIFDIKEKLNFFPNELSTGEKQRVAISRALISEPDLILADEPTSSLDYNFSLKFFEILKNLNKKGKTIILTTVNKEVVDTLKSRTIILEKGKVISDNKNGKVIF